VNLEWMLIRGTGLVAFGLLAGSTIWGLLLALKITGRLVKAKPLTWLHEGLAVGALLATGAHMFFLWDDDFIEFGPRDLFIPGASSWEPLSVAFGIVAFYVMFIVSASFYVKKWIGQAAWRVIHFLAFGTFAAAAIHGVLAGTDTLHPVVLGLYVGSVAIVVMLLMIRIAQEADATTAPQPARPTNRATIAAAAEVISSDAEPAIEDRLAALRAKRAGRNGATPAEARISGSSVPAAAGDA